MVAGVEFGKDYAQLCIQTDQMKEPESLSLIAGREEYLMSADGAVIDKDETEKIFRKFLRLMRPYGAPEQLKSCVFCIEENTQTVREMFFEIAEKYHISREKIHFVDKKESFCVYLFHQSAELSGHSSLLVENSKDGQRLFLFYKERGTVPAAAAVREVSEKKIEDVLAEHGISSVFLVGDFEKEWLDRYLKLLKCGRRVFAGKNLYAKGAAYRAKEFLKKNSEQYFYLGEDMLCSQIALKSGEEKDDFLFLAKAGRKWYEADVETEVLLLSGRELEFVVIPISRKDKISIKIPLDGLPERPPKTTRLKIMLEFENSKSAKLTVKDLGFGELFPRSDMRYEGELRWEQ